MLEINTSAPLFSLKDQYAHVVSLQDFLGKRVVLYFYPKNNTPACTRQACSFRDSYSKFAELDVAVIGISRDTVKSHREFIKKHNLPFILLSDTQMQTIKAYKADKETNLFGKPGVGTKRMTYIIDPEGRIEKVFAKANPDKNAQEILDYLQSKN